MSAFRTLVCAAATLAFAAPAFAQVSSHDANNIAPNAADIRKTAGTGEKVICKSVLTLGSLTERKKTCRTEMEWDDLKTQQRHKIEDIQRQFTNGG